MIDRYNPDNPHDPKEPPRSMYPDKHGPWVRWEAVEVLQSHHAAELQAWKKELAEIGVKFDGDDEPFNQSSAELCEKITKLETYWPEELNRQLQAQRETMTALKEQIEHYQKIGELSTERELALKEQVIALGWQKLTPETKWERGSRVGAWYLHAPGDSKFGSSVWYNSDPTPHVIARGYTHFRRDNPPAQEKP